MAKVSLQLSNKNARSCDGCTKCCEGWLSATIHGEEMYPGKPCQFVDAGVGCKIYNKRPKDPCKNFACMWKVVDDVPEEFKPSEIDVIFTRYDIQGVPYLAAVEAGSKLDSSVLSWFVTYCVARLLNACWTIEGKTFWMGSPEFNQLMMQRHFPT